MTTLSSKFKRSTGIVIGRILSGGAYQSLALLNKETLSSPEIIAFLLFIIILPLANGACDWFSWAISRELGKRILRTRKFIKIITYSFIDLVLGAALSLSIITFLVIGFEGINLYMATLGHPKLISTEELINIPFDTPLSPIGIWILLMLASTLIPTFLHLAFATAGLSVTFIPQAYRNWLARCAEGNPSRYMLRYPAFHKTFILPISGIFVILLVLSIKILTETAIGHGYFISSALTSFSHSILNLLK